MDADDPLSLSHGHTTMDYILKDASSRSSCSGILKILFLFFFF